MEATSNWFDVTRSLHNDLQKDLGGETSIPREVQGRPCHHLGEKWKQNRMQLEGAKDLPRWDGRPSGAEATARAALGGGSHVSARPQGFAIREPGA